MSTSTPRFSTFADLIRATTSEFGERTFVPRRHGKAANDDSGVTYAELGADVEVLAAGLTALGYRRGDHIGLISENRYEWLALDLACATLGIADVPRGTDTSPLELLFILKHARTRFAFAETDAVAKTLLGLRDELPKLEGVCVMAETTAVPEAMSLTDLRNKGRATLESQPTLIQERSREVRPSDLLTIVYTSGTTADPKGVMLTHANLLSNIEGIRAVLQFTADDVFLSVLPAWHAYERVLDYIAFRTGAQLVYTDRRKIKEDLLKVRPTVFAAVPRIWESIHDGILTACRKKKPPMDKVLSQVLTACRAVGDGKPSFGMRMVHRLAGRSILPKFRAATGGRLRIAVSGGGSLPAHVDACLLGLGIPLINGYGLTETSPVVSVRPPGDNRPRTIGRTIPDTSIEIRSEDGKPVPTGEQGLVWIKGPQVMTGYFENPTRTAAVLQDDWFNSGDLGCQQPDGHFCITGRAKDTIVLAGGENVEPEHIEAALKTSPYVDQAVVLGQDKKTLGAILVPHLECLEEAVPKSEWSVTDKGVLEGEAVRAFFRNELNRLLTTDNGFRPLEKIQTFRVLSEALTIENGLLTQTLKVKRHKVTERHAPLIDSMW